MTQAGGGADAPPQGSRAVIWSVLNGPSHVAVTQWRLEQLSELPPESMGVWLGRDRNVNSVGRFPKQEMQGDQCQNVGSQIQAASQAGGSAEERRTTSDLTTQQAPEPDSDDYPALASRSDTTDGENIDREISQFLDSDAEGFREPEAPRRLEPITWCPRPRRRSRQSAIAFHPSRTSGFIMSEPL